MNSGENLEYEMNEPLLLACPLYIPDTTHFFNPTNTLHLFATNGYYVPKISP